MRAKVVSFEAIGLVLTRGRRGRFTLAYGEILTAERLPSRLGVRLHTRTSEPVRVSCRGERRTAIEDQLRRRGVRIVDEWGAILAPTLSPISRQNSAVARRACDNRLTMPEANRSEGDPKLIRLFDEYRGRVVSPGGAAALLGLSRQTIHTLCKRGELRAFRSDEDAPWAARSGSTYRSTTSMRTASASADPCAALDVVIRSYYSGRVRIERAIDAFLDWRQLERDATPRSIDSYRRILWKLAEAYPEVDARTIHD